MSVIYSSLMQYAGTAEMSTGVERAIAILMSENACDYEAATCALAGSALSQGLPMDEVAAAILEMASRSEFA